jgi:hypothetical protein
MHRSYPLPAVTVRDEERPALRLFRKIGVGVPEPCTMQERQSCMVPIQDPAS